MTPRNPDARAAEAAQIAAGETRSSDMDTLPPIDVTAVSLATMAPFFRAMNAQYEQLQDATARRCPRCGEMIAADAPNVCGEWECPR